jgi:hypothetical protein
MTGALAHRPTKQAALSLIGATLDTLAEPMQIGKACRLDQIGNVRPNDRRALSHQLLDEALSFPLLALLALYWLRLGRGRRWRIGLGVDTAFFFLEFNPSAGERSGGLGGFVLGSALLHG